jgi:chromate transporter
MRTWWRCASSCRGPASSQVGIAIGLFRGGKAGAVAAFLGFMLPSAAALVAFGLLLAALYPPVLASAIRSPEDFALGAAAAGLG